MRIQEWLGVQSLQEADKAKGKGRVYNLAEIAYKEHLCYKPQMKGWLIISMMHISAIQRYRS